MFDRISEANRSDIEVAETSATQGPGGGAGDMDAMGDERTRDDEEYAMFYLYVYTI